MFRCTYLVKLFSVILCCYNEIPLIQITFSTVPLDEQFYSESIECTRERNMLFASIVLDYRIKVDSQDTEQHYPLILCFGFK